MSTLIEENNWKKIIIHSWDSMQIAIEILNSQPYRIVLVIDKSGTLVGTITDGDIRRALLRHLSLDEPVSKLMFTHPSVAKKGDSKSKIFSIMKIKRVKQIPIVDNIGRVVGIDFLKDVTLRGKLDNPVFLMAGGFGTRLHPLTKDIPKPLLKVGGKAILETILEQFINAGFYNFYLSTHYKSELVRAHFGNGDDWGVSIQYVHEQNPLGTAGSLSLLPEMDGDLPILMMNADVLTKLDLNELLEFHVEHDSCATMGVKEYDFTVPYGVVTAKDHMICKIEEKPVHKFFINAGVYVLNPKILSLVKGSTFLDMPNLLEQAIEKFGNVNMFPIHEYWLDIGQIDQFKKAQTDILEYFL
jgi:dTDP-glucose pyrophosphorylase